MSHDSCVLCKDRHLHWCLYTGQCFWHYRAIISQTKCVYVCSCACILWWMSVFGDKWVPIICAFYRQTPCWLPNGNSVQSSRTRVHTHLHTQTHTHSHNELLLGGPRLWHICCGGDIRHSCRGSQDSPCITQRKKGGTVVEGSNDNFTSKPLLHKTMAAYKDTLRHILSNWPTDL